MIHVHSAAELLWLARRWARGARFVFTDHGYFGHGAKLSYRIAAALLRRCRVVLVTVSAQQRSLWIGPLRIRADRVRMISNGVPDRMVCAPDVPPPPWATGQSPGHPDDGSSGGCSPRTLSPSPIVGAMGRLEPQKGFTYLLDAFGHVSRQFPAARLLLVGDGSPRETLHRRIPVERDLAGAGHPDSSGGHGIVVGGVPEALGDGTAGILVPPGDPQALASAMQRLLQDSALRERLGRSARQRYQERFTHTAMARAVAELYARL